MRSLRLFTLLLTALLPAGALADTKILCLGDSITEGAPLFKVYRPYLAQKLADAGLEVTFVGPKKDRSGLAHAGYGGKSIEAVAAEYQKFHKDIPADILLIHGGHNHTVEEKPVPGILKTTEGIIAQARMDNANATVLLAKVIPSGKLPKYEYIPELNTGLEALAERLDTPEQRVIIVDQAEGFDWKEDTILDMVHPNASGAEKMAAKWFAALQPLLAGRAGAKPAATVPPEIQALPESPQAALALADKVLVYKTVDGLDLEMHVFLPKAPAGGKPRPGVLYIHGGGWAGGDPSVHAYESLYLSRQGIVAATIRYRLIGKGAKSKYATAKSPADCLADAKSAMRYFRGHAADFSMDPDRIAAGGGSAGGHLVAALNTVEGFDDPQDDLKVSCKADALVMLYPAFDLLSGWKSGIAQCRKAGIDPQKFSPATLADKTFPPSIILVGNLDPVSPPASNDAFIKRMKAAGRHIELFTYDGKEHKLFERARTDPHFQSYLIHSSRFFQELGWLPERPLPPLPGVKYSFAEAP